MFSKLSSGPTIQAGFIPYKLNVNFRNSNIITIDICNSGTASVQILQVYIGTSASTTQSQTTPPPTPITIATGAIASFNITYSWAHRTTYYFKVVPNSGAALMFQEQAPS